MCVRDHPIFFLSLTFSQHAKKVAETRSQTRNGRSTSGTRLEFLSPVGFSTPLPLHLSILVELRTLDAGCWYGMLIGGVGLLRAMLSSISCDGFRVLFF